jgi:DinB family protein
MTDPEIGILLVVFDQAYDRASWHGPNLRGALRGLGAGQAAWRPGRSRHNIWEITVHTAYWKYATLRSLTGAPRGSFAIKGSNWFERPLSRASSESAWKADVALLDATHRALRDAIGRLDPRDLRRAPAGRNTTRIDAIAGIAAHDLYHAGQIQLIKRMMPGKKERAIRLGTDRE